MQWQEGENAELDTDPLHWDHAVILTGLDVHVVDKHGKISSQVVGHPFRQIIKLLCLAEKLLLNSVSWLLSRLLNTVGKFRYLSFCKKLWSWLLKLAPPLYY